MAITPQAAMANIRAFYDQYLVEAVTWPTQFDNQPLTDKNGVVIEKPNGIWARMSIKMTDASQVAMAGHGANTHRHTGNVIVQVFDKVDEGYIPCMTVAQLVYSTFLSPLLSGLVTFQTPRVEHVGADGPYYQINVICPFWFDHIG